MTESQFLHIVFWASRECKRQQSGELSVARMVEAFNWHRHSRQKCKDISAVDVDALGCLVDRQSFRQTPVTIRGEVIPATRIHERVEAVCEAYYRRSIGPHEFYKELMEIHPFKDGNGRVGSIIWNWMMFGDDFEKYTAPPDFWGGSNG